MDDSATIVSPITAPGHGPVAAVRASGGLVRSIIESLVLESGAVLSEPRKLVLSQISESDGVILDQGLVAFFPGPNSFTGEDCVEFHVHGSPFIVARLVEAITKLGARPARAGEFSERAFLNGQIDLCQAEAICDLIAAETEMQARSAQEQLSGKLSTALERLGEPLRDLLAMIEAHIDFPEDDIGETAAAAWSKSLTATKSALQVFLASFQAGRLHREGALVVLAGLPNAGKSSLLNALLGEDRAIVTELAGTTRDSIEERASIDGFAIRFCDTAGLRNNQIGIDLVESLGIKRSNEKIAQADLVLYVADSTLPFAHENDEFSRVRQTANRVVVINNKCDLLSASVISSKETELRTQGFESVFISALNGTGIDKLRKQIVNMLNLDRSARTVVVTSRRHFEALNQCAEAVDSALKSIQAKAPLELIALEVRTGLSALEGIVGATPNEEILGRIFSRFCIGK